MAIDTTDNFVPVATLSTLIIRHMLVVELQDQFVVLVHLDGEVYCIDDICTHDGGTLSDGELDEHCLVCPRHGAKFDVRTGDAITMPATEPTRSHEVKIVGDQVYVKLSLP